MENRLSGESKRYHGPKNVFQYKEDNDAKIYIYIPWCILVLAGNKKGSNNSLRLHEIRT